MEMTLEQLKAAITEVTTEIVDAKLASLQAATETKAIGPTPGTLETPGMKIGTGPGGDWAGFGDWLTSVNSAGRGKQLDERLAKGVGLKTTGHYAEQTDSLGGFLVPDEFRAQIYELSLGEAIIRPRAATFTMSGQRVSFPVVDESDRSSSVYGGVVIYWTDEAAAYTESNAKFGQLVLTAKKMTGLTYTSNEMLADSAISLSQLITRQFGRAMAFEEDEQFIQGNGAGRPIGLLNCGAAVTITAETAVPSTQTAATVLVQNLIKMYARLMDGSHGRAVWLCNNDVLPELMGMTIPENFRDTQYAYTGVPVWINNGSIADAPPATIFGRPVIFTEHCNTLGSAGDIVLADLSYYLIADRQDLEIASSSHVRFVYGENCWRFTKRLDGSPWVDAALTPKHSSNTLSPIVILGARA